jgi:TPR repeat protein
MDPPMTDRKNLPAKPLVQDVTVSAGQSGSLAARGLAAVLALSHLSLPISAESDPESLFQEGMRYQYGEDGTKTDDEKALKYFLAAAERNHAEAQLELAYLLGENGDAEESDQWILRSASLGFGPALRYLAMHSDSSEEECDEWFLEAREWYEPRAMAGDAKCQFEYAEMLLGRTYDRECKKEGRRWLLASAEQNFREACMRLGYMNLRSEVTEQSTRDGIRWMSRAADLGDAQACIWLGQLNLQGHLDLDATRQGRQPDQRFDPDKGTAVSWYERAINMGSSRAACSLGSYYLKGVLLDQDLQLAEAWLLKAAQEGSTSAKVTLGTEYSTGERLRLDPQAAVRWLESAAESWSSTGLQLAEIFFDGKIVPKNFVEGVKWLDRASESEVFRNKAMKVMAAKCFDGRFAPPQEAEARAWLARMAALAVASVADMEQLHAESHALHLAELYELGLGVDKDFEKAVHWHKQSAGLGLYAAKKRLKELGIEWKTN